MHEKDVVFFFLSDSGNGSNLPTTKTWHCGIEEKLIDCKFDCNAGLLVCWESNLRREDSPKLAGAFLFLCCLLVWYSYPNLVDLYGKRRQIYHTSSRNPMIPMIHGMIS